LRDKIRAFFRNHIRWRVIVLVYIVTLAVTATYTTVSIDATTAGERGFVLSSINFPGRKASGTTASDSLTDIHLWINPFATQYQLSVTGYLPAVVDVKPFFGSLIVPDRDLTAVPTILIRPYFQGLVTLTNGGTLRTYKRTADGFSELDNRQGNNAWFMGPQRKLPTDLQNSWQIELTALGMDPPLAANLLQRWRSPKAIATKTTFAVGDTLCALIANSDETTYVAGAVVRITRDDYIDLPLRDFPHESTNTDRGASGTGQCVLLDSGTG